MSTVLGPSLGIIASHRKPVELFAWATRWSQRFKTKAGASPISAQSKLQTVSRSSCSHDSCDHLDSCHFYSQSQLSTRKGWKNPKLHVWRFMFDQHGTLVSHAKRQKWQWHATFSVQWPCARWLTETSLMVCPTSCLQQLVERFMKLWPKENCHGLQDVDQFGPHGCQVHLKLKMWRLMMGCRHQACRIGATGTVSAMKKGGGFQNLKVAED